MSVRVLSSFLKSPSTLNAEEHPIRAVKIVPLSFAGSARRNFHLALLLDSSGSMEGDRIGAVKRVMGLLIEALTDGDILTIISYESAAQVLASATLVDAASRVTLHAAVENLRADGGTNLEAGLSALRGITTSGTAPLVDAAFILTDGHINQGLTAASGLTRLLTATVPLGTPVFTLGFGADHNSRMLRDMALRSRGSYTYADAAELIPATIGDIISGLSTEVGRGGRLRLHDGWRALEITAEAGGAEFIVGTLVSEKDQWVILEGPVGPLTDVPPLEFVWRSADGVEHTETCTTYTDFDPLVVAEQFCRCRVATVQTSVQEMLEVGQIDHARAALTALGAELDASPAKDRTFVISLRATVDEMIDALVGAPMLTPPPMMRASSGRAHAWPNLAPILSRMASNTAALGAQRGFLSHIHSTPAPVDTSATAAVGARASHSGVTHTFCSPSQARATATMTERYSQVAPAAEELNAEELIANLRVVLGTTTPPRTSTPTSTPSVEEIE
jgi:Mg-chelatase subunit ChlD